jgi:hypothetical protein
MSVPYKYPANKRYLKATKSFAESCLGLRFFMGSDRAHPLFTTWTISPKSVTEVAHMKKRFLIPFALVLVFLVFVSSTLGAEFQGSRNYDKYHYPDCRWAQKINPGNFIKFSSPEEAVTTGYVPCKVCKPPLPSKSRSNVNENTSLAKARNLDGDARSGCCSWHGGVCGCDHSTGRVICCDGTLSPSCT